LGAQFAKNVSFANTRFNRRAVFNENRKPGNDFDGAIFLGDVSFNESIIDKILLRGAKFSKNSRIFLDNCDYNMFDVNWEDIKDIIPYNGNSYLKLITNFRILGYFSDADECYYHYRDARRKEEDSNLSFQKLTDTLAWITCGYGVRPQNAVLLSILAILIFAGIYYKQSIRLINYRNSSLELDLKRKLFYDWLFPTFRSFSSSRNNFCILVPTTIGLSSAVRSDSR